MSANEKQKPKNVCVSLIIEEINALDDIGGAESLKEYIEILEYIKSEIEIRIYNAKNEAMKGGN